MSSCLSPFLYFHILILSQFTIAFGEIVKVFPSANCPYHGVKVTFFGKSAKVLTGEFSTFTIKSLQNNTSDALDENLDYNFNS